MNKEGFFGRGNGKLHGNGQIEVTSAVELTCKNQRVFVSRAGRESENALEPHANTKTVDS